METKFTQDIYCRKYTLILDFLKLFRTLKNNYSTALKIIMPRNFEKSSGWIVYRKSGKRIEILLLKWRNSRNKEELVIPKWKIESWEVAKDTAIREISEEAGLPENDLEIIKFVTKLNYTYTAGYLSWNPVIDKDVYLFIVRYSGNSTPIVRKEERFIGYTWIDIEKIPEVKIRFDLEGIIYRNKPFFT